jgi:DNA-binding LacI/PurR family transcriptional regulator
MSTVNLQQLARHLGLSKSTATGALKDSHEVGAAAKEKVFAAARELNCQPNPNASSLHIHFSKTIASVASIPQNRKLGNASRIQVLKMSGTIIEMEEVNSITG